MKYLVVLLGMAVLCCLGREITHLGGWLLSVQSKLTGLDDPKSSTWKHGCSGTLVSTRSALTCASCVVYPDERLGLQTVNSEDLRLYSGIGCPDDADIDPNGQIVYVRTVQIHPDYFFNEIGRTPNEFNFAILITKKPFKIGKSLKVLPLYSTDVDEVRSVLMAYGTESFAMTWNFYMNGNPVNEKPWGEISVMLEKIDACRNLSNIFKHFTTIGSLESYSCAKGHKGLPICRVDTGSPIIYEGKLLAIIINDRLDCDEDEEYVVISGINNAMSFLTDPDLYRLAEKLSTEDLTTLVDRARSSQGLTVPKILTIIPAMSGILISIK